MYNVHVSFAAVIVGGVDMMTQSLALAKKPHVVIATPGRLVDHLENTKGFNLRSLKFLIMDEADRILNMDFEVEVTVLMQLSHSPLHSSAPKPTPPFPSSPNTTPNSLPFLLAYSTSSTSA